MERTNELLFQMILYISVIWILSNCQQLYESECNSQHDSFYRVCKVNALETTIQRSEKQNKELLLRLSDREQKNLKSIAAYRDILKLYGSQIVPNGMYVVGFFLYNIIVLLITHCLKCIWYHLLGIFLNNKNWDSQKDFLLHLSMIKEKRCSIHCVILFPQWKIIKLQIHWNYYTMYNWFTFDLLLFCHFIIHCQTPVLQKFVYNTLSLSSEVLRTVTDITIVLNRADSFTKSGQRHIFMSVFILLCFRRKHWNVKTTQRSFVGNALRPLGNVNYLWILVILVGR